MTTTDRPSLLTPLFVTIIVTGLAYFLSFGALVPILPVYAADSLGAGPVGVGISVGAFSFSALFLRPYAGRLTDRYGRRTPIVVGAAIVLVSVLALLVADSLATLIAFRLLMGVGEALFFVGAVTAVGDIAPPERRGEAVSLFSLALYGGLALGPIIGETALGGDRFAAAWLVSAGLAAVCVLLALRLPDTRPEEVRDGAAGARPARIIHPAGVLPGILLVASVLGFAGFNAFIALYARDLGLSRAGLVFLVYASLMVGIRAFGRRLPDILGFERAARIALVTSAAGLAIIAAWASVPGLFTGAVVFAVGQALAFPALMSMTVSAAPPAERGAALGTFSAFFDLSFGLGPIALGAVNAAWGNAAMFWFASAVALAGFVVLVARGRRRPEPASAPVPMPSEA